MEIGIGLAVAVALMTNLASLLKHRGCQDAQAVCISSPLAGLRDLAGSRWFVAGWLLAGIGWLAHVAALSLAPISMVQAVLAGGAVTLAVLSQRLFGDRVEPRQWLALTIGAVGLILLVVTLPQPHGADSGFSAAAIIGFEGGLILLAAGIALGHRSERFAERRGVLRAVLAGLLFALAGIAIKAVLGGSGGLAMIAPLIIVIIACGAFAQYSAVGALQGGGAIETIGLMGLVANAVQIVGGLLVFGDPLSPGALGIVLQGTAFAMVCFSALLLPSTPTGRIAASRQALRLRPTA
jgi:drug/metabolite transporter (DMT)-like permease